MKSFLKYIDTKELSTLIEKVDDFYEYTNNSDGEYISKSLVEKTKKIESMSAVAGINLNQLFKEKLIFKLFNENDWDINKIKQGSDVRTIFFNLSKTYGINIPKLNKGNTKDV